jgi:hypothetical protein
MPAIATSVELIFDEQLSAKIRGVWDSFTVGKIRYQPHAEQGHPHITVSVRDKNLIEAANGAGMHKLSSRVFPENIASRALLKRVGFEEIGIHRRHGKLDGLWRDCVIVERLLDEDHK